MRACGAMHIFLLPLPLLSCIRDVTRKGLGSAALILLREAIDLTMYVYIRLNINERRHERSDPHIIIQWQQPSCFDYFSPFPNPNNDQVYDITNCVRQKSIWEDGSMMGEWGVKYITNRSAVNCPSSIIRTVMQYFPRFRGYRL